MPTTSLTTTVRLFAFPGVSMLADPDTLLTGAQAAHLVGVSRQLIRYWHDRGHLEQVDGRYRYQDVLEVESRMRHSRYSSRGKSHTAA